MAVVLAAPAGARAQLADEEQPSNGRPPAAAGYRRGQGRGFQYGAYLASPVYLNRHAWRKTAGGGEETLSYGGGFGVQGRIGWEFPAGFSVEVYGGLAANGVNTHGRDVNPVLMRADLGAGLRYTFINSTMVLPFVQLGGGLRWFRFDWPSGAQVNWAPTGAVNASVGAQIELAPYFALEAGVRLDYTFASGIFGEGLVSLMPFVGATLYLYDENG